LSSGEQTLVLNKVFGSVTGTVAYREGRLSLSSPAVVQFTQGSSVRVVLRRNELMLNNFNVHTAFPTR